jgi:hypothetical protein
LVQAKNMRERSSPVRPLGVEKTSRLRSRDPVASGVNFRLPRVADFRSCLLGIAPELMK